MKKNKEILLVALGGNALIGKEQEGTIEEQFENLKVPVRQIASLSSRYRIIITHGNAPQAGNLLLQQECCDQVPGLPLEILVAQTQCQIGYMIESTLDAILMEPVVTEKYQKNFQSSSRSDDTALLPLCLILKTTTFPEREIFHVST